jgi:hypothetical protein
MDLKKYIKENGAVDYTDDDARVIYKLSQIKGQTPDPNGYCKFEICNLDRKVIGTSRIKIK